MDYTVTQDDQSFFCITFSFYVPTNMNELVIADKRIWQKFQDTWCEYLDETDEWPNLT